MQVKQLIRVVAGIISLLLLSLLIGPGISGYTALGAAVPSNASAAPATGQPLIPSDEYIKRVHEALAAKRDVWGELVLARPEGPTFDNVKGYLAPLMHGDPDLTDLGTYYIPFGQPGDKQDTSLEVALHVADGSQFYSNSPANNPFSEMYGNTWNIYVGAEGDEMYGSSPRRLKLPDLADGYPILQTEYVDAQGVRYRQESFAARAPEITEGISNLVSWIRVTVEPGGAGRTLVNFVPSHHRPSDTPKGRLPRVLELAGNRLVSHQPRPNTTYAFFSAGGKYPVPTKNLVSPALQYAVDLSTGKPTTVYLVRLNAPWQAGQIVADADSFAKARASVIQYWDNRLGRGARFEVPEREVMEAQRGLLAQNLNMGKFYSIGNFYQTSYTEQYNALKTLGEYGFPDLERQLNEQLMDFTQGGRQGFDTLFMGIKMWSAANYYKRTHDKEFIDKFTPTFARWAQTFSEQIAADPHGLLQKERWAGDIGGPAYALCYNQGYGFAGLRDMVQVWSMSGHDDLATQYAPLVARFGNSLQDAIRRSEVTQPDGSLFVPAYLLGDARPYDPITGMVEGSYWNLVITHPLGVGVIEPHSARARGLLRYMSSNGSFMLGMIRFSMLPVGTVDPNGGYGMQSPGADTPYNYDLAEFLADNDEPEQLVLGFYGLLAHAVTRGTYVGGEGTTVGVVPSQYYRQMCRPPNSVTTAAILNYLRLMLVHETAAADGRPNGLQLAYSTPCGWLAAGQRIAVSEAPTDFGPASYSLEAMDNGLVRASLKVPPRLTPQDRLHLRVRVPAGQGITGVTVNGKPHTGFDRDTGTIDLTGHSGQLELVIQH
ncbi:MAG: glucosidase family protein [Armatimonadota bacterium]